MGNKVYQVNAGGNIYDIDDKQADIDAAQLRQDLIAERERAELAEQQLQQEKQSVVKIVWGDYSHIDSFTTPGVYDITGERLTTNDGLPIANASPGHTIAARLTVLSSSIKGDGAPDDKCITQMLILSNRTGGDGDVYIRTGRASMANQLAGGAGWEPWGKLQQNIEVGAVATYNNLTDNGIYSGVYIGPGSKETFVLVVINDYALATQLGVARRVSQFKYSVYTGSNVVAYHSRVWDGNVWSAWSVINADEIASMINAAVAKLTNVDAELITRIQALASWVEEHGVEAAQLAAAITAESQRARAAEEAIKNRAVDADTLNVAVDADALHLDFSTLDDGAFSGTVEFPAATTEKAGVMSATDKTTLDNIPTEIEKIKNGDTIVGQAREIHSRNGKTVTDSFLVRTTAGSGTIGDGVATLKSVGGNIIKNLASDIINPNNNTLQSAIKIGEFWKLSPLVETQIVFRHTIGTLIPSHQYYIKYSIFTTLSVRNSITLGGGYSSNRFVVLTADYAPAHQWYTVSNVLQYNPEDGFVSYGYNTLYPFGTTATALGNYAYISTPIFIDLTEMFGEAKANQMTKEECDKLFGIMDALPQGLSIANPKEFKSTGYNQADPNKVLANKGIENGAIVDKVGSNVAVVPCLPCKIGVGENNGYCIHGAFDEGAEKVYLTPLNPLEVEGELYPCELAKDADKGTYVPQIKGYMLVEVPNATDLCVHFLWSEDCDRNAFEPYYESKVELPTISEMSEYGFAGIQSSGTLACDEIDFERGVYVKRIGCYKGSEFKWIYQSQYGGFRGFQDSDKRLKVAAYSPWITPKYAYAGAFNLVGDKQIGYIFEQSPFIINSKYGTDVSLITEDLKDENFFFVLAEPIEYPLPKVDNNYISSDYGVEQFDGAVPCNANNLYYMRSLAGETRNFLDRLMAGMGTDDATAVADRILAVVNPAVEPVNVEPETPIEQL